MTEETCVDELVLLEKYMSFQPYFGFGAVA